MVDAGKVGHEQRRKRVELVLASADFDFGAVLILLAIADVVAPGPRENGVTILHFRGYGEVQIVDTIRGTARAHDSTWQVPLSIGRATTNVRFDDLPAGGILEFGCIGFVGHGQLTGTTAMSSSIRAAAELELERIGLADLELSDGALREICSVAWEV